MIGLGFYLKNGFGKLLVVMVPYIYELGINT